MSDETQGAGKGLARQIIWLMTLILCAALASPAAAQDHQYSAEQIQAGYRIYVGQCQLCHGFNGDGIARVSLSRQQFPRAVTDDDIRKAITTGNPAGMPPFALKAEELDGLVAFIRSGMDQTGTGFRLGDAVHGKTIYESAGCAACHRLDGKGPRTAPALDDIGSARRPGQILTSLTEPTKGTMPINRAVTIVTTDGRRIAGPGVDRSVVFQNASLLPWRTIAGNVRYGMELQKRFDRQTMIERTEYFVRLVGLAGFERHYPSELSGGMQQRVNLARALASDPSVLLMDEPFAALDAQTRELMQAELLKIWTAARKTVVFITHQINEALYLADRVVVMSARPGRVKGLFQIPFPRPRPLNLKRDPAFLQLEDAIWQLVEETPERLNLGTTAPAVEQAHAEG